MGGNALTAEQEKLYEDMLDKVDWGLPGMEALGPDARKWLTTFIRDGVIVNSIECLGWGFWPTKNQGYYDSYYLRKIADFLEIQNKPFWDEYEAYCARDQDLLLQDGGDDDVQDLGLF